MTLFSLESVTVAGTYGPRLRDVTVALPDAGVTVLRDRPARESRPSCAAEPPRGATRPRVLLMDEPTSSLDADAAGVIERLIRVARSPAQLLLVGSRPWGSCSPAR